MIWADRLAFFLWVVMAALLTFVAAWASDRADWGTLAADGIFIVSWKVFLPLWLFLRLLDWVLGGPRRRRTFTVT